jgi:major type 1 subunit fimbrin (pilin)
MNTSVKRALLVAGITTAMALPLATQASDGTITFTGAVTANTCTVGVNGGGATATVSLPTVGTSALTGATTTAAGTFFYMTLSACTAVPVSDFGGSAPTHVVIYFEAGPNVNPVTGGLINTVTGSNVEVNLYNASSAGKTNIRGSQITPGATVTTGVVTTNSTPQAIASTTQYFYAGYSTAGAAGNATPGAVSTSVTYSLIYQ